MSSIRRPLSSSERVANLRSRQQDGSRRQTALTNAERQRRYRERRRDQQRSRSPSNNTTGSNGGRDCVMIDHWRSASIRFETVFINNKFGHICNICDRLWFEKDLKKVKEKHLTILEPVFGHQARSFMTCANCFQTLERNKLPTMSTTNGFTYPPKPSGLPLLNPISARLISPRIPFMAIRRLRRDGQYGIIGQVINIPIDVNSTINQLPRELDDDYVFNVSIKRRLIHRSSYLNGYVKKKDLKLWLEYLVNQPLYRHLNITVNWHSLEDELNDETSNNLVEDIDSNMRDQECLAARQHTLLWNEENVLDIAPGQRSKPLNIIFDHFAEELSFPQIYYGVGRIFDPNLRVTPYMMANSEIRRSDRRGVTPEHILYMAMKILRLRVVDGMFNTFRCVRETEQISRRMLEDRDFLRDCIERNLSFLKSIPNSSHYWLSRKKDLFAMMRQLGKPTAFLTLSANEIGWPDLLHLLHKLNDYYKEINLVDPLIDLDRSMRSHLVNEDPVICCVYFNKLVDTLMNMLQSKQRYNPFGKYRVIDFFMRIEFQHRGSPHAHILLWLDNDPKEEVSEDMPATLQLVTDLCSVNRDDLPDGLYSNQVHRHTFTCTKRGESSCRFNIPYWPMKETQVLIPMAKEDNRRMNLKQKLKKVRENLEVKVYDSIEAFLLDNRLDEESYLNLIRSNLARPTLLFKREMSEIMTNTFNPWIATVLNSNMDLQFILDEYSCASYVVDYVNKSNRGTGNLHRELIKLNESHPELTHEQLLRRLGSKILNTVELSAQEGAWYLLRQPMSRCSRDVVYIPTCWPWERQKSYKTKSQLDRDNIDADSTDIWTKSIIQKYEERPNNLKNICLADFAARHTKKTRSNDDFGEELEPGEDQSHVNPTSAYYERQFKRIIRFRNYDPSDTNNFKRELVTLYLPFDNEQVDVLDRNKFIALYEEKLDLITSKMKEFSSGCDIEHLTEDLRELCNAPDGSLDAIETRENFVRDVLNPGEEENFDDLNLVANDNNSVSAVKRRANVMEKEVYCAMMRTTNERQRELVLEVIHRISRPSEPPIKIFFTGPAGCGKTYILKAIMETVNRYSQTQNQLNNAYVACASTGKAAVNIDGTTVHSAFHITQSRRTGSIARETLQQYRQLFANVNYVIIDEVSMIGNDVLHKVNQRLQEITGEIDEVFGGMNIIFCGDFRQLPPVNATPVYKGSRNHLEGATLWQSLDFYPLTQVMRQSDDMFASILTKIGNGFPLLASETELIESRFHFEQWCDENLKDVVRLFHQNHSVDAYNRKVIIGGFEQIAKDAITGYSNNEQLVSARTRLHRMSTMETGGLPYSLMIATDYPYMLTSNVHIEDGLVNGAIGTLRFIENGPPNQEGSSQIIRVWLEFSSEKTGAIARIKFRPVAMNSRGTIHPNWTPISLRSASITLGGTLRCKRMQFPLSAACAMTIHKSQGGTFKRVVVYYDKSQQNQLVYVALSRVTSIEGLFLTNSKNDFKFHHSGGNSAPSTKEIRDEYSRLSQHPLATITGRIKRFLELDCQNPQIIICTINAQSFVAHFKDVETDRILMRSDILAITETWMDETSVVNLEGFELISSSNKSMIPRENSTSNNSLVQSRRIAGGVAIYRKISSQYGCVPIQADYSNRRIIRDDRVGDISLVSVSFNRQTKFIIAVVYIHPNISKTSTELFLIYALASYAEATRRLLPTAVIDTETPLLVTGDFNTNIDDDNWLSEFLDREFKLIHVPSFHPTTLGNTTIDLTFVRNLEVVCMPYVSYFSYHRPLFNRIRLRE